MKQDEAEKLARRVLSRIKSLRALYDIDEDVEKLCNHILSGDMKREIENAAIAMVADEYSDAFGDEVVETFIRTLITPAKKENSK